jgi:hypothetical protein
MDSEINDPSSADEGLGEGAQRADEGEAEQIKISFYKKHPRY